MDDGKSRETAPSWLNSPEFRQALARSVTPSMSTITEALNTTEFRAAAQRAAMPSLYSLSEAMKDPGFRAAAQRAVSPSIYMLSEALKSPAMAQAARPALRSVEVAAMKSALEAARFTQAPQLASTVQSVILYLGSRSAVGLQTERLGPAIAAVVEASARELAVEPDVEEPSHFPTGVDFSELSQEVEEVFASKPDLAAAVDSALTAERPYSTDELRTIRVVAYVMVLAVVFGGTTALALAATGPWGLLVLRLLDELVSVEKGRDLILRMTGFDPNEEGEPDES